MSNLPTEYNEHRSSLSAALAEYAASVDSDIPGEPLKYKQGEWLINEGEVSRDEEFRVELHNLKRVWERRCEKKIVDKIAARLGEKLPTRDELGFDDKSRWEPGLDGFTPQDPWELCHYVGFTRQRDGAQFVYKTSSEGGRRALGTLAYVGSRKEDQLPIVCLHSGSYISKKFGNKVFVPAFAIKRWVDAYDQADVELIEPPKTDVPPPVSNGNTALFAGPDSYDDMPF
jgi:hypothetical protein